jgi:VWFA-related protein
MSALAMQAETGAQPKFRSSVDVVSVTAIVRDRKGRFVRDLVQKDFTVAEAGVPRRILDFRSESDGPIRLAMLFDVSGSMRIGSKEVDAHQAARQVLSAMRPTDKAGIFVFDTQLVRVKGFTSDFAALDKALDHMDRPYGQTSLYDAIAGSAHALAQDGAGPGQFQQRSAVVVFTDGIDTKSRLTSEQVSSIASAIDVPVYVVAVMAPVDDPRQSASGLDGDPGLRTLSQWTGGELFTASAPAHASIAARQIVDELRHQYVIAFEASARPGWRPLEVRARDPALVVRSRAGYTAGGQTVAVP